MLSSQDEPLSLLRRLFIHVVTCGSSQEEAEQQCHGVDSSPERRMEESSNTTQQGFPEGSSPASPVPASSEGPTWTVDADAKSELLTTPWPSVTLEKMPATLSWPSASYKECVLWGARATAVLVALTLVAVFSLHFVAPYSQPPDPAFPALLPPLPSPKASNGQSAAAFGTTAPASPTCPRRVRSPSSPSYIHYLDYEWAVCEKNCVSLWRNNRFC